MPRLDPNILIAVSAALVALLLLRAWLAARRRAHAYYLRKSLFTAAETAFLQVLESVLPPGVRVFGKVRLEDFLGVKPGLDRREAQAARNRINRKHVDFLLVRTGTLAPVAGIELDDRSHETEDRRVRDRLVDAAFASAGLPLLHVPVRAAYSAAELKGQLADLAAKGPR